MRKRRNIAKGGPEQEYVREKREGADKFGQQMSQRTQSIVSEGTGGGRNDV